VLVSGRVIEAFPEKYSIIADRSAMSVEMPSSPVRYVHPAYLPGSKPAYTAVFCLLGTRTCTLVGFGKADEVVVFEEHSYQQAGFLSGIFANHPLLASNQAITRVISADARQIVFPEALYTAEGARDWMQSCYFVGAGEDLIATPVPETSCRVAAVCPSEWTGIQAGRSGLANGYALAAALLQNIPAPEGACARVLLTAEASFLVLWNGGSLQALVAYEETDAQSVVYRLMGLLQQHQLEAANTLVFVEWLHPAGAEVAAVLDDYFLVQNSAGVPESAGAGFPSPEITRAWARLRSCVL
jgi:hypothetical protein